MPDRSQLVKAGIGSLLIGAGIAFMVSATQCVDCDQDQGEGALEEVAAASAEMAEPDAVADVEE